MCPVSYLMPSGYLSNSGAKSKERLACTYGGWSWQRNGLALLPYWSESCPCKITPAEVWKRKSSCISCKFYCHSPWKEYISFWIRGGRLPPLWSCCTTGDGAEGVCSEGESAAGKCLLGLFSWPVLKDVQGSKSHITPRYSTLLLHHPYCWKTGPHTSPGPPFLCSKDSCPNPPKPPWCTLYVCSACFNVEHLYFWESTEDKKINSHLGRWLIRLSGWEGAWREDKKLHLYHTSIVLKHLRMSWLLVLNEWWYLDTVEERNIRRFITKSLCFLSMQSWCTIRQEWEQQ